MNAALKRIPSWLIITVAIAGYLAVRTLTHASSSDVLIYRDEGLAVRHGLDLYGQLPNVTSLATYPPFAAILFVPFSVVPPSLVWLTVLVANLALVYLIVRLSLRLVGTPATTRMTAIVGSIALFSEPVLTTLRYGQINLVVLALVLWDFTRAPSRSSGTAIGLAAALKVTPAIFIPYLLLTRRYRAAATASATFGATVFLPALVLPHASAQYWTHDLFDLHRVGRVENAVNQTLRGAFVRVDHTRHTAPGELLIIGFVLLAGLALAAAAHAKLGDRWGVPTCAITGLLTAPIAWTHHWVWCIPIAVLLWQHARAWLPAAGIFWTYAVWFVPHQHSIELHFSPLELAASNWYVLFGVCFLLYVAARLWLSAEPPRELVTTSTSALSSRSAT
jgi:alpha-1,2-mannosyltransferase